MMADSMQLRNRPGFVSVPIVGDRGETSTQTTPLLDDGVEVPAAHSRPAEPQSRGLTGDVETKLTAAVPNRIQDELKELLKLDYLDQAYREVKRKRMMHDVIENGSLEMFKTLFNKLKTGKQHKNQSVPKVEEQINLPGDHLFTTVHVATIKNKPSVLQILLDNGGDRWAQTDRGQTPLHIAAYQGFYDCTRILLTGLDEVQKKQYMDMTANDLSTALIRAAKLGNEKTGRLLGASNVNLQDCYGNTALHYAAQKGSKALISFLLDLSADTSKRNENDRTPLEVLISNGKDDVECFESLFKATPGNETTETLKTLLKEATLNSGINCVKIILEKHGAMSLIDYQFPENDNNSALHLSLTRGHYKISLLLLNNGAKTHTQNDRHEYPVHLIAKQSVSPKGYDNDRQKVHKKLMKCSNEHLESATADEKTAMVLAVESGNEEMVLDLLRRRCSRAAGISQAAMIGNESSLKMLLQMIPERQLAELGKAKQHPLHVAAQNGKLSCCKILVENLKNPNLTLVEDNDQKYPVDLAFEAQHYDVFRYLLENMKFDLELEDFAVRLHGYCKESIRDKNRDALDVIVSSSWSRVAFDSFFCSSLREMVKEPRDEVKKPCSSLALLIKTFPEMVAKALDQYVTVTEEFEEHDYTPFEFVYYNEHDGMLVPSFVKGTQDNIGAPEQESSTNQKQSSLDSIHSQAKTFSSQLCWEANPLVAAAKSTDNAEVMTHRLSKSWMERKYNAYAKKILFACVGLDFFTALFTSLLIAFIRNTNQLESMYNGATKSDVTNVYNGFQPRYSVNESVKTMIGEINAIAPHDASCSSFHVSGSAEIDYSPGSAVWNRSVCAIGRLESRRLEIMTIQIVVFILFLINSTFGIYFIYKIFFQVNTSSAWYKTSSMVRPAQLVCLIVLIPGSFCEFSFGLREVTVWQIGVVSVLLAWLSMINTLNKVPNLTVFMQITWNFLIGYTKLILFIFLIILAFALPFHFLLLAEEPGISTLPYSLIKTLVWMLGDLGYNDTFLQKESPVIYPIQANLLFVLFVTTVGAFVFNLIVKNPTDLVDQVKNNEDFFNAVTLLKFLLFVDEVFPKTRRKHTFRRLKLVHPKTNRSMQRSLAGNKQGVCDSEKGSADLYIQQQDLVKNFNLLRDELAEVSKLVKEMHSSAQPVKCSGSNHRSKM